MNLSMVTADPTEAGAVLRPRRPDERATEFDRFIAFQVRPPVALCDLNDRWRLSFRLGHTANPN